MKTNSQSFNCHLIGIIVAILFVLPSSVFAQKGSLNYLKSSNGFNGIKLGANLNTLAMDKLSYLDDNGSYDADSCIVYEYNDSSLLKSDTTLNLRSLALKVYQNKIVNIYVFFKKADGYKVLSNFLTKYGQFTERPNDYADIYNWNSSEIKLSLKYQLNTDIGLAIYSSINLEQQIEINRKKLLQQVLLSNN